VLKDIDGSVALAPLYDFGPSFLDARSIVRVIRWDGRSRPAGLWTDHQEPLNPLEKREWCLQTARVLGGLRSRRTHLGTL